MRKIALLLATIGLGLPVFATAPAQATSTRTWVSGVGYDTSATCSRTAPCKTFSNALSKTTPGGEINCLDGGDFAGGMNITFAVTISCEAGTAGIIMSSGSAITITAAATDDITLRGLDINGGGTGGNGIFVLNAKTIHIENCAIRGFLAGGSAGIFATNSSNTIFIYVTDSVISDNSNGLRLTSTGGFKVASLKNVTITGSTNDGVLANNTNVFVNITESVISGNGGSAVNVAASFAEANVDRTTMANNAVALNASASGATIRAVGNNIFNNTTAFGIAGGATIATDGQNRTGGNAGGQNANASLTLK